MTTNRILYVGDLGVSKSPVPLQGVREPTAQGVLDIG